MLKLDLRLVEKFLLSKQYSVEFQEETDQLYILLKIQGHDFPLFIRIYEGGDLLQLVFFIPCTIKTGTHADLSRLLHALNKEIDIPGFGMDETTNVIFYRCMIPSFNKHIEEDLLYMFMQSLPLIAESFTPVIVTAAGGHATYDEIIKKMQELRKNSA